MLVILDTNILVSFSLTNRPPIATIREAWLTGELDIAVTETLLAEYARVTGYPHLSRFFQGTERQQRLAELEDFGIPIEIAEPYPEAPDPNDSYLFAMLMHPLAAVLVTGDKALLKVGAFEGKPILSPAAFVQDYLDVWG